MKRSELSTPKQDRSKDFLQKKLEGINQKLREADEAMDRFCCRTMKVYGFCAVLWTATGNLWWSTGIAAGMVSMIPMVIWHGRHERLLRKAQRDVQDQIASVEFREQLAV